MPAIEKSNLFWNAAGKFLVPRFEPSEPTSFRSAWWYTFGRLLGLYIIRFGRVPRKISPILLLGLFSSQFSDMYMTFESLEKLDEDLAATLHPWFELPVGGGTLPEFSRDITNLLAGQAQMDVSSS